MFSVRVKKLKHMSIMQVQFFYTDFCYHETNSFITTYHLARIYIYSQCGATICTA